MIASVASTRGRRSDAAGAMHPSDELPCPQTVPAAPAAAAGHPSTEAPTEATNEETSPVTTTVPEPAPEATDNPFIPDDANLGDCVSSLPRPGCGSEAHGGVGQWLVFGALVAGLGFIGWRVSRGIRKGRPSPQG
jgi:hypothetical protein